jgi:hypothetical protein
MPLVRSRALFYFVAELVDATVEVLLVRLDVVVGGRHGTNHEERAAGGSRNGDGARHERS